MKIEFTTIKTKKTFMPTIVGTAEQISEAYNACITDALDYELTIHRPFLEDGAMVTKIANLVEVRVTR